MEQAGRTYPEICFASVLIQKGYVGFIFSRLCRCSADKGTDTELLKTLKGKNLFSHQGKRFRLLNAIRDALKQGTIITNQKDGNKYHFVLSDPTIIFSGGIAYGGTIAAYWRVNLPGCCDNGLVVGLLFVPVPGIKDWLCWLHFCARYSCYRLKKNRNVAWYQVKKKAVNENRTGYSECRSTCIAGIIGNGKIPHAEFTCWWWRVALPLPWPILCRQNRHGIWTTFYNVISWKKEQKGLDGGWV